MRLRLDASLLTMTAGRVFAISPPSDGSKSTHQTSPRSTGMLARNVSDSRFGPFQRLLFPRMVGCHLAVGSLDILWQDVGTSKPFDKLTDPAPPDCPVKALVNGFAYGDCKFTVHRALYVLYTYNRLGRISPILHPCAARGTCEPVRYHTGMEQDFPNGKKLRLIVGDITKIRVDAIVNAANSGLRGGGGVDGAIHRAGGPAIMRDLDEIRAKSGGCPTGSAVATAAGSLPAQYVFHAVGPVYGDGKHGEPDQLAGCYRTCLDLAEQHGVRTISFPAISTGVYGYPAEEAARIVIETVAKHLNQPATGVRDVLFVLFDQGFYEVHARVAASVLGGGIK
ncbi:MAG TPA: O-acetyl-ADP-ribose deacetylase [Bryobacteraceae bacterium]|nr:O-acetyl-ADP-ribose deacetylase [Bryobacteraceae bacterium]